VVRELVMKNALFCDLGECHLADLGGVSFGRI